MLGLPWQQVRQLRGEEIAYVPQDPAAALNPSIRIGKQIVELMELRGIGTAESRLQGARDGLAEVGLPNDDEFLRRYSHQLSGGQVQRVALAMAFLPKPKVLVLDEPTTGLDVTTQGMVLQTMGELCRTHGVAALYVTHDLAVIANIADRVAVMYAGQIAELGHRDDDLRPPHAPLHAGAARLDPPPEPGPRTQRHPRPHARTGSTARRLPVPRPLRVRDRRVQRGRARAARGRARPLGALHPRRGHRHLGHLARHRPRHRPRQGARHHPQHRGPRRLLRPQAGRLRRHLRRRQGRGRRPGGRVRLRQDHDLPLRRRPAQGVDRPDHLRGQRSSATARGSAARPTASASSTSSRTPTSR